jgi:hypothetical protein
VPRFRRVVSPAFGQVFKSGYVGLSKVRHMNVVADACAIRRVQIVAENFERRCGSQRGPQGEGNQMRLRLMQLADGSVGMSAGCVEVTQRNRAQSVGDSISSQRVFEEQLCRAVRIDGHLRGRLGNGQAIAEFRKSRTLTRR